MSRTEKISLKSSVIAASAGAAVTRIFIFGSLREVVWPCMLCLSQGTFWRDQTGTGSALCYANVSWVHTFFWGSGAAVNI